MRLIKHIFLLQIVLLLLSLFGCGSEGGSTPKSVLGSDGKSSASISFEGKWTLLEKKKDCNGQSSARTEVKITQDAGKVSLSFASADRPIDCEVVQTELQCAGRMALKNSESLEIAEVTFWYDESRNLQGEADWTRVDADQNKCKGSSVFSSTAAFEDRWAIHETQQDCPRFASFYDYSSQVISTGATTAEIHTIIGPNIPVTFQCDISEGELRCSGQFKNEYDVTYEYNKYNIRLTDPGHLTGECEWDLYAGGSFLCSGTSRLAGVPEESADDAQAQK